MTTTLSNSFRTQRSGISAQDLIKLQNSVIKNGMVRLRKRLHIGKWPHRFVVLTNDSLYVYMDETSKAPQTIIALLGFNRVARCDVKGQDWCFSIQPVSNMKSIKAKTLACFSDAERKSWMKAVKNQIYVANNIQRPKLSILDKIMIMTGESIEDDYVTIEHAVYESSRDETGADKDLHLDDHDYDSSVESDSEIPAIKKTTRSMSLPYTSTLTSDSKKSSRCRTLTDDANESKSSEYETCEDVYESVDTSHESNRRPPSDVQPKLSLDSSNSPSEDTPRPASDPVQILPPRYSEVYEEEPAYVNLSAMAKDFYDSLEAVGKPSLESLCTVPVTETDNERLIDMLLATEMPGTYLIRKSRSDSSKVIMFLGGNNQVLQYKLLGTPDNVTISQKKYFASTEALLQHYTSVEHLPDADGFLINGFYQVQGKKGI